MNERIKELAGQANIHFSRLGILDGDPNGMVRYLSYGKMEEFAQLIVKECCDVLFDNELGGYQVNHVLKEHFGVEE